MSQFEVTRISLEESRALNTLARDARRHVPVFNGGDNGREAPLYTRRQVLKTSSGVVAVTFMPVWGVGGAGCEPGTLGLIITLFNVAKEVFNLLDANDPIRGQMGFDNQTGGPLNIETVIQLKDVDRGIVPDSQSVVLEIDRGDDPVFEYSGLEAKESGTHQNGILAQGETSETGKFTVKQVS